MFFVLGRAGVPIGLAFFVWLGLVSVFLIAQFWSYANDIYSEEQGKRLFAIIATGGSLGAIFGPRHREARRHVHTDAGRRRRCSSAAIALFNVIERVHTRATAIIARAEPITGAGGFALVLRDRYLLLIACMLLVANLVNTTGEYILSNAVREHAMALVPARPTRAPDHAERREIIKAFYSDFFLWVNLVALPDPGVPRVAHHRQARRAPRAVRAAARSRSARTARSAAIGGLALVRVAKIAENGTDYSLQNTVRQALFLPTDARREVQGEGGDRYVLRARRRHAVGRARRRRHSPARLRRAATSRSSISASSRCGSRSRSASRAAIAAQRGDNAATSAEHDRPAQAPDEPPSSRALLALAAPPRAREHRTSRSTASAASETSRSLRQRRRCPACETHAAADARHADEPTAADVAAQPVPGQESGRIDSHERERLAVARDRSAACCSPARARGRDRVRAGARGHLGRRPLQLGRSLQPIFFDDRSTLRALPDARTRQQLYGFNAGARFVHRNLFGDARAARRCAPARRRIHERYEGDLRTGERLGEHIALELRGEFERRPHEAFYGIGNRPTTAGRPYHRQELVRAATTLDIRVAARCTCVGAGAITRPAITAQ